jgi:glycosyltransferase involved in cell wall biosynthesis
MTASPRAVFGMPAFNHAHKLREALDSILLQTRQDFCLIISDDNSTDDTRLIAEEYAGRDHRVTYHRTEHRLGYIGNARRSFELGRRLYPKAEFFAWASDHDLWNSRWLEALAAALERHPDAVVACPLVQRIDAEGAVLWTQPPSRQCCTAGEPASVWRFSKTFNTMAAGNMVYGLMRADAVEKAGGLPWQLLPDRLLIATLSLYGTIVTVPEYLWYRRYRGLASIDRQINASFLNARPGYLRFPWWIAHSAHFLNYLALNPAPNVPVGRAKGAFYAALYLLLGAKHVFMRRMVLLFYPLRSILRRAGSTSSRLLRRVGSISRRVRKGVESTARRSVRRVEALPRRIGSILRRVARLVLRRNVVQAEHAPDRSSLVGGQ